MWLDERDAVCIGARLEGSALVAAGCGVGAGIAGAALLLVSGAGALMPLSGAAIAVCCGGVTGTVFGTALSATTGWGE